MVMAGDGTVEQVTHYYPFGGVMRESTNPCLQPYKYGGKELDRTSGLDAYDFGARMFFADRPAPTTPSTAGGRPTTTWEIFRLSERRTCLHAIPSLRKIDRKSTLNGLTERVCTRSATAI